MREDSKRSHTAEGAAALRAAGARVADPAKRNPDTLAERFIGPSFRLRVRVAPVRALTLALFERLLPGLFPFITARTKHFDALLLAEVAAGIRQVVILGAGADSRAYRFADALADVRVCEVDHPATSAWKRGRVRALFGDVPERVSYVVVDFNSETLDQALDNAGVDRTTRTFFIWEGVAPYLPADAVDTTLACVARFAPGSSVAFDYLYQDALTEPSPESQRYVSYLAKHAEPLLSGVDPATIADHLAERGLELVDNAGPDDLRRRHLAGTTDPITTFAAIAHARVPSVT